jgi:nucleotide-binding universal stress UspA family protein
MGTIFVAYGGLPEERTAVLEFAAERAAASGDDLFVYHAREVADEPAGDLEAEVRTTVDRVDPDVPVELDLNVETDDAEAADVSKQTRLTDAILGQGRELEYVVMGEVEHGRIEGLVLPSMTEAVLNTHRVPVLLVPV